MSFITALYLGNSRTNEGITGPAEQGLVGNVDAKLTNLEHKFRHAMGGETGPAPHRRRHAYRRRSDGVVIVSEGSPDSRQAIIFLIVLVIVDLIILITAIHYIIECSRMRGWSPLVTLLLIILLFTPGIGGILSIGIIIYGLAGGCKPNKLAFKFF